MPAHSGLRKYVLTVSTGLVVYLVRTLGCVIILGNFRQIPGSGKFIAKSEESWKLKIPPNASFSFHPPACMNKTSHAGA